MKSLKMADCLGLYIEDNLIKYAKVSKNNNAIKVESFGTKFFDDFDKTYKQIIDETYSYKTPIAINSSDEMYNKFEIFSLLSKKDIDEVVQTEFEGACYDNNTQPNVFEQRTFYSNISNNTEKMRAISIAVPKTTIEQKKKKLNNKITGMFSTCVALQNLIRNEKTTNQLIINIENFTTVTEIKNGEIYNIDIVNIGMKNILDNIKRKENSYSKAYEICKNTTIYLDSGKDLEYEENEYLVDIMPTLYELVTEIRKLLDNMVETIDNIYITGSATTINNIDIYFQDYLKNIPCEILKPSFITNNSKINIKDYIEVNSAIALAIEMLDKKTDHNFIKQSTLNGVVKLLTGDLKDIRINKKSISTSSLPLERFNYVYLAVIGILIAYIFIAITLNNKFDDTITSTNATIQAAQSEITEISDYGKKFNSKTSEYKKRIKSIQETNSVISENKKYRNAIPNLLNNIMVVIPKNVQLTSIENTTDSHIIITAVAKKYEQLAYFKTKLVSEEILTNVVSDAGTVNGESITITIEGELP